MLKRLASGGAALATFAGMLLVTPAHAETPRPDDFDTPMPYGNVIVCGNSGIESLLIILAPIAPTALAEQRHVDCGIHVHSTRPDHGEG
ncbi:hypothetical protein [Thermoactinospora rubra]|uniref:hypothetical protein n=1 Tax=Thermoactinospora rubra TaxID=1088767 RepID=UPI000A105EC3|nr:hypothetical protein [Thermoactinospora rubra]